VVVDSSQTLKAVIVLVPDRRNQYCYEIGADSSFDAARQAIEIHEQRHPKLTDDTILTIILGGKSPLLSDFEIHNANQPTFRHRVGQVRKIN
jgi:hypothetical protein